VGKSLGKVLERDLGRMTRFVGIYRFEIDPEEIYRSAEKKSPVIERWPKVTGVRCVRYFLTLSLPCVIL
jgi:hypothetical protein